MDSPSTMARGLSMIQVVFMLFEPPKEVRFTARSGAVNAIGRPRALGGGLVSVSRRLPSDTGGPPKTILSLLPASVGTLDLQQRYHDAPAPPMPDVVGDCPYHAGRLYQDGPALQLRPDRGQTYFGHTAGFLFAP